MGAASSSPAQDSQSRASAAQAKLSEKVASAMPSSSSAPLDASSAAPSAERQSALDASVRDKIAAELRTLKKHEKDVEAEMRQALERQEAPEKAARGKSAEALRQQLSDVREKIERHKSRRAGVEGEKEVQAARERVLECLKNHPNTTLECVEETQAFKRAVARAEKGFIASLASSAAQKESASGRA